MPIENIDTDQIIPAKFLKGVDKEGYGENLFYNWRYNSDGTDNLDFILNAKSRKGAKLIIAGNNFGCGSSREHAAWALAGYGIKAIISTQFADIFKGNAFNNGIIPIELSHEHVQYLMECANGDPSLEFEVDLNEQEVKLEALGFLEKFELNAFRKKCLLEGVDETEYLVKRRGLIEAFEKQREN